MRTAVIWVPDWPVVAAGVGDEPSAVVFANRVVACSPAARLEGVRRGLRRREAQGRCPQLIVLEHDPGGEARAFEPVVAAVETLTPRVEVVRPGLCAFATRGPSRYFGGDAALAEKVASVARAHGSSLIAHRGGGGVPSPAAAADAQLLPVHVGVADGRFAAGLAARTDEVIPPGESPSFLAPFDVESLDRPELADLLGRLGIRTLGDFGALPASDVLARFGADGAVAHRLARGLDERPLAARVPPPDLAVSMELDPPAERVDTAAFAARSLANELHGQLADMGLACTRIAIEAETEHGEHLVRLWRHDGALTAGAIAERVRWQLDGWISSGTTTAGVTLIRLVPDEVKPDAGRQLGFWGGTAEADDRAARALARVQGMLGPDGVVTAVLVGGRGPADRVRLVPWGDAREVEKQQKDRVHAGGVGVPAGTAMSDERRAMSRAPWPGQVPPPAPATVHTSPVAVDVVDARGRTVGVTGRGLLTASPARVGSECVTGWAGPWLYDEKWWDPEHRRRARFQMTTDGGAYLVAVEGSRWFIEASYD